MKRHVKQESSFEAAKGLKASGRKQKVAFLKSLSSDEISALNKGGSDKLKKIASAFEGYVI